MNNLNFDEFKQAISDYVGVAPEEITRDTDVYDDLFLDSLGLFGLGSEITETFKLNVPLSLVASISKVGEIFDLLNEKGTPTED
ncbi:MULTISPECIES: acyl carrier protein [Ruminococcus]|jgi:acyl carrier protein|uniref:Acyl carrier protein n=1 Tax=Ruminococcus flavefaciens TaxID=1265 RepID=A0A315XUW3_RUMFL|nr:MULTISPECIES: acyl carrier protein [Ruminococcus]MBQ6168420.1 acyl carrier protein [Ruminococcus sp.]MBQ6251991.1 acyl carrier protein [Ruminococcus sp.]MBR1429630.1 acyl carrier protein [Ruminococcus sp.]PWJ10222.1 acyl carrier protein [Ruminococcus flavefaciens]SSA51962.1 acyl carrier protein [Ruminococcus flavefaciens]